MQKGNSKALFNFASDLVSTDLQKENLKWICISVLKISKFMYATDSNSKSLVFLELET